MACWTCSRTWWRNRSRCTTPPPGATGCWRPCANTRRCGSPNPAAATTRGRDNVARLRLAVHMKRYWLHRGLMQLGLQLTVDAVQASGDVEPAERYAALFAAGQLEYLVGEYAEARRYLEESLALMRAVGD